MADRAAVSAWLLELQERLTRRSSARTAARNSAAIRGSGPRAAAARRAY